MMNGSADVNLRHFSSLLVLSEALMSLTVLTVSAFGFRLFPHLSGCPVCPDGGCFPLRGVYMSEFQAAWSKASFPLVAHCKHHAGGSVHLCDSPGGGGALPVKLVPQGPAEL